MFTGRKTSHGEILNEEGLEILWTAISLLESLGGGLKDGSVNVVNLQVLDEHSDRFVELYSKISKETTIKDVLQQRLKEFREFLKESDEVFSFLNMCSSLKNGR